MTRRMLVVLTCMLVVPISSPAQIAPPNSVGVSAGHEHFRANDVEAMKRFWMTLGAKEGVVGKRRVIYVPGVVLLTGAATPDNPLQGGSEGTTTESITFRVRNLKDTLKRMSEAGYQTLAGAQQTRAQLMAPNDMRVELVEDAKLTTPIATGELLIRVPDVAAASAWYARWFGAKIVREGGQTVGEIPGMNMRFVEARQPVIGTAGRALEHIGFEVVNLEAFMKKLADGGVTIARPFTTEVPVDYRPILKSLGFVVDPWGTRIELNEGFTGLR